MCRYAYSYKPHMACFACQKSFKRRLLADIKKGGEHRPARCPQCAGPMANMGLDFAPPKRSDNKAWRTLSSLFETGETFHGCGCSGPGYRPRSLPALRTYYAELLVRYERSAQDSKATHRTKMSRGRVQSLQESKHEARAYWNGRAQVLRTAIEALA